MKSFTGIIFWSILLICSACTDENETNNGKRTDCYNGTPLTVRATATGFENIPGSEKPSTRASVTDEHLKTEFVDGDSIGIFSIKDGTIVDDINNIPLVYNVSNDSWNPGASVSYTIGISRKTISVMSENDIASWEGGTDSETVNGTEEKQITN